MYKCIMISIYSLYVEKIFNGEKTIEVRKFDIPIGTKTYIYVPKKKPYYEFDYLNGKSLVKGKGYNSINGKVVASFVVSKCEEIPFKAIWSPRLQKGSCLTFEQLLSYLGFDKNGQPKIQTGYGWHISQLKIFDKPKELSDFRSATIKESFDLGFCQYYGGKTITKAPQNYVYVEELE